MKKILSLIICLSLIIGLFTIVPVSVSAGNYGDWQYKIKNGEVIISCYINDTATTVTVPEQIEDKKVTTIGNGAFGNFCPELQSVTIPENVTRIEYGAFKDNTKLDEINIEGELTFIGYDAFYNTKFYNTASNWENGYLYLDTYLLCRNEEQEVTSADIKAGTTLIAEWTFEWLDVETITSINVPEGVKYIGDRAFAGSRVSSISLPSTLLEIGKDCFDSCYLLDELTVDAENENFVVQDGVLYNTAKTEMYGFPRNSDIASVTIPDSITEIPDNFFSYSNNLQEISLPDTLTKIGNRAFYHTGYYKDENNWGADGVLYIDNCLIDTDIDNYTVDEVIIKENTYIIADWAFEECADLAEIDIHNNIKYIGTFAFSWCDSLTKVTVGSGIKEIGEWAFSSCDAIDTFTIIGNADFVLREYTLDSAKKVIIQNGTIGEYAFTDVENMETVEIGNGVTAILDNAFTSCGLEEIVIPDSVETLGEAVFWANYNYSTETGLKKVTLGSGITEIPEDTFAACDALEEIRIKGEITSVGSNAFGSPKYIFLLMSEQEWGEVPIGDLNYGLEDTAFHFETLDHIYEKYATQKATFAANGIGVNKCKYCEEKTSESTTIHYVKTAKLSSTTVTYNGKLRTPTVTLKDSQGEALEKDQDYTVDYQSGRINAGTYSIKVDLKGNYEGSKNLDFTIKPASVASVKLSSSTVTYNGKTRSPSVIVKDEQGETLTEDVDYTVKVPSGRKNPGKYKYTVTMKGNYTGTKTLYLEIKPGKQSISKITGSSKKTAKVYYKKDSKVSGYKVYYSTSKSMKGAKSVTVSGYKNYTKTFKTLKSGKTYYFRVRSYKKTSYGTVYGDYSSIKSKKVK